MTEPDGAGSPAVARPRMWPVVVVALVVVVAVTAAAVAVVQGTAGPAGGGPDSVVVTETSCASGWTGTTSGPHRFVVVNSSNELFDVELVGSDHATIYGEVETLAPGTTVPVRVVLGPGSYSWRCTNSLGSAQLSPVAEVRGPPVAGVRAYLPVSYAQLASATATYRYGISLGLARLASDTDALTAAVAGGDRPDAERLWLVAHLDYARLGAAYDTFGDFADEIDGRPDGLPQGVDDPSFHGFLRLEYGLWTGQPMAELTTVAQQLDTEVHQLVTAFPTQATAPTDLPLRTHEILENTLQFELTGETDEGSHTTLATASANVAGTQAALAAIAPLLEERAPSLLATVESGLASLATQLGGFQQPGGGWLALQSLTTTQHEALDGAVEQLLEELAAIPDLLELSPNAADQT